VLHLSFGEIGFAHSYGSGPKASKAERIECTVAIVFAVGEDRHIVKRRGTTPHYAGEIHSSDSLEW
jgi:hypothetical protein